MNKVLYWLPSVLFAIGVFLFANFVLKSKAPTVPVHPVPATVAADVSESGQEKVEDLDWATVSKDNPGYIIDLNGDGVPDMARMEGGVLYWFNAQKSPPVPVVRVLTPAVAYWVGVMPNHALPSLKWWNPQGKGFCQHCLGVGQNGVPFFGNVESL